MNCLGRGLFAVVVNLFIDNMLAQKTGMIFAPVFCANVLITKW